MKNPVSHWVHQRITALLMVFVLPWFLYNFIFPFSKDLPIPLKGHKVNLFILFLFLVTALHHMVLGLLTIIDDYVHDKKLNLFLKVFIYLKAAGMTLLGALVLVSLTQGSL
jgi:succinate dehydrogenase / fumarate reductase membrane anchor subunit